MDAFALWKTLLTALSLSPTYLFNNSGPLTAIKLALLALATALAKRVFPQPGGPYRSTPAGVFMLNASNFSGYKIGKIILLVNSSFRLYKPPISCHWTLGIVAKPSLFPVGWTWLNAFFKSNSTSS